MAGFDPVTLAMAKKYTDSQRLGYSAYNTLNTVLFDGNIADKATIPGEAIESSGTYVHASDEVYDGGIALNAIVKADGVILHVVKNLRVLKTGDGVWLLLGKLDITGIHFEEERVFALSVGSAIAEALGCPAGTYVWTETISGVFFHLDYIEGKFTETIHPIDPKFLPAPKVLDLTKYDAGGQSLNDMLLSKYITGGGVVSASHTEGTAAFWRDVSDGNDIRILIDADIKIVANVNSTTHDVDGNLDAIEISFVIAVSGTAARVTVLFGNFTEMSITVVVEPVSTPG